MDQEKYPKVNQSNGRKWLSRKDRIKNDKRRQKIKRRRQFKEICCFCITVLIKELVNRIINFFIELLF